jgi:hypothetical protein
MGSKLVAMQQDSMASPATARSAAAMPHKTPEQDYSKIGAGLCLLCTCIFASMVRAPCQQPRTQGILLPQVLGNASSYAHDWIITGLPSLPRNCLPDYHHPTLLQVRLFSVIKYESMIHEFDPWFNYRVTQFLTKEGFYNTWNFFDSFTWYPLGRVVGGTMYPGLIFTAGFIWNVLQKFNIPIDVQEVRACKI